MTNGDPSATVRSERALRVLVVEDNVDSAETLAELLEIWGHRVQIVHHGHSALAEVHTFEPDVVILDIGLPGIDGYEVARSIRAHDRLSQPMLVALTGYGQEEDRRRSLEIGFDVHLTKPVNPDQLQRLLAGVCRDEGREQEADGVR
jgi:CheY-like chemotaxis protein